MNNHRYEVLLLDESFKFHFRLFRFIDEMKNWINFTFGTLN